MISKMIESLIAFSTVIEKIDEDKFRQNVQSLQQASIGEHTRHIIECYQELFKGYSQGVICYEDRMRKESLQTNPLAACLAINDIISQLHLPDKQLDLKTKYVGKPAFIKTTFYRELLYNYEHLIHHQALIRIGMNELCLEKNVGPDFGVAPSTIAYKNNVHG